MTIGKRVESSGPQPARLLIVGEAPGGEEEILGRPFVGASGRLLDQLLAQAGLDRASARVTNLCKHRPPQNDLGAWVWDKKTKKGRPEGFVELGGLHVDPRVRDGYFELVEEVERTAPAVIVALGNWAMWALVGRLGVTNWRGSLLATSAGVPVIPTFHPAAVLRQWEWRIPVAADLRRVRRLLQEGGARAVRSPAQLVVARSLPDLHAALDGLQQRAEAGPLTLAVDIETAQGEIDCIGFADSPTSGVCVPFFRKVESGRKQWLEACWGEDETKGLAARLKLLLSHPNVRVAGQNFNYDQQWMQERWGWHVESERVFDTMVAHHALYCESEKGLDYLASLYCRDYTWWKDEIRGDPSTRWRYNLKDCCATFEVAAEIQRIAARKSMEDVVEHQMARNRLALKAMLRGVRVDEAVRRRLGGELKERASELKRELEELRGAPLPPKFLNSSPQLKEWARAAGCTIPKSRGGKNKGKESLGLEGMRDLARQKPELLDQIKRMLAIKALGKFETFLGKPDPDGRMRSTINVAGTVSYRPSSSENAFGRGMNLLNLPKKPKLRRDDPFFVELPNTRTQFVPDPGCTIFDLDLKSADPHIVAWESNDPSLKRALRSGWDIPMMIVRMMYAPTLPDEALVKDSPAFVEAAKQWDTERDWCKKRGHATNYGGKPPTIAQSTNSTAAEVKRWQAQYFDLFPGIAEWHKRVDEQRRSGCLVSVTGHRRFILGRTDLPECLAWYPQVGVGWFIDRLWMALDREPRVEVLLQVYDSLMGQTSAPPEIVQQTIQRCAQAIALPYEGGLTIPVGVKFSAESWGACG